MAARLEYPLPAAAFADALLAATDSATFVAHCHAQAAASAHATLNLAAAEPLAETVRLHRPAGWDWFLGDPNEDLRRLVVDYHLGSALNGGYFAVGPDGRITQWERNGSGSTALVAWLAEVRARRAVPGTDLTSPASVEAALADDLAAQPLAAARMAICREAADQGRLDALVTLVEASKTTLSSGTIGYRFTFSSVLWLAALYPEAYAADPFRKRAILFFLLLSGHFAARGIAVENDLPIPSDYQMSRGFAFAGVIAVSPAFTAILRSDAMLDVRSDAVMDYRAAAVAAARHVGGLTGREDWLVDGALFGTWRKDPAFKAHSLPPVRCASIWF